MSLGVIKNKRLPEYPHNFASTIKCVLQPVSLDGSELSNLYSALSPAEKEHSKPEKKSKIIKIF